MIATDSLFVPDLAPAVKHATVFQKFDALGKGETLLLINDHDPIPLYYEMKAERGDVFEWNKLENGPELWKVEITKTAATGSSNVGNGAEGIATEEDIFTLNVTQLPPRMKHPTIFQHFDALAAGKAFCILNDHDPKPLYYQLIAERGPVFTWTYLENGPKWWRVQIKKNAADEGETVGQIAAKDIRKAEVFKKYGIDFCCGGKKSLKQACEEVGVDAAVVEAELNSTKEPLRGDKDFNRWEPDFLADYIYNQHHLYYYDEAPVIGDLLTKVANHHGATHPELQTVYTLFVKLAQELNSHFMKEEKVLFPFIKAVVAAKRTGNTDDLHDQFSIQGPVQMMEADHDAAGGILEALKNATNNYTAPEGACNSFQLLYRKLRELDEDLHQHIHLENNILFPKALKLEKELRK